MKCHEQLQTWVIPGILGFYQSCEVTVCCLLDHDNMAHNLFTLLAFESREIPAVQSNSFLTSKNECFGNRLRLIVTQYHISIPEAIDFCRTVEDGARQIDTPLGLLQIKTLTPIPPTFVPKDSTQIISANRVLKNNFCGGSMVIEWYGSKIEINEMLTEKESQHMALRIRELLPIDLFTISDRIGNILFQLQEQIAFSVLSGTKDSTTCSIIFDKRVTNPQKYYLNVMTDHDCTLTGFQAMGEVDKKELLLAETGGPYVITLIDTEYNIPIFQQTTSIIRSIRTGFSIVGNLDSVRTIVLPDGSTEQIIINSFEQISVGNPEFLWKEAVQQRQYKKRMDELITSREFIRYGKGRNDRIKALCDLRTLMNSRPDARICIWDPYLSAGDLLETWYFTENYGLELRAITSNVIPQNTKVPLANWIEKQRVLLKTGSNQYGVNLYWRVQHGMFGFSFHDRFLILLFSDETPRVWSLGTSINSFGKVHHILQLVSNPRYIVDDFEELWEALADPLCLIWNSREERNNG